MIGQVLVLAKRVADTDPFYVGWQPVTMRNGKRVVQRPTEYRSGGKGVHYKILHETFICASRRTAVG